MNELNGIDSHGAIEERWKANLDEGPVAGDLRFRSGSEVNERGPHSHAVPLAEGMHALYACFDACMLCIRLMLHFSYLRF
jgi:hypothetical protein